MTNTESRIAIELEELALGDDAHMDDDAEQPITEADIRELAVYGFDSDKQTLVGLGPVERARRARNQAAEAPDSQRAPQSESPGPFIADDDEIPPSLRGRRLGPWAVAAPVFLLVALVAVLALRGLAPGPSHTAAAGRAAVADVAPPRPNVPLPPADPVPAPQAIPAPQPAAVDTAAELSPPPAELPAKEEIASLSESTTGGERSRAGAPVVPAASPVNLPELASPTVVDMSSSADANVGALNVTSNPPANVVLDGRPLGKAPRLVKVPAGLHTVVFIHPLYGRQSLSVNVGAGTTTNASADF